MSKRLSTVTNNTGMFFFPNGYGLFVTFNGIGFTATLLKGVPQNYVAYTSERIGGINIRKVQQVKKYAMSLEP
jgi:hypothetical protein